MKQLGLLICFVLLAAAAHAATINKPAPSFVLMDSNGKKTSLKDFQGKVIFVNFWATWCAPCRMELPQINKLADEYKEHDVAVLGINVDTEPDNIAAFLKKLGVTLNAMHVLQDPSAIAVAAYSAQAMPSSFIIDQQGIIRFVHVGYVEKDPSAWRSEINQLIKK